MKTRGENPTGREMGEVRLVYPLLMTAHKKKKIKKKLKKISEKKTGKCFGM